MKMKYFAAMALLLWLGVTGWLASMVIVKPAVLRVNQAADETEVMLQTRSAIARNRQITQSLALADQGPLPGSAGPVIALSDPAAPASGAAVEELPPPPAVSMVLTASGQRSAVVNGEHVRVGQRLSSGARIRAIGPDWVRLDDPAHGRQTLSVPNRLNSFDRGSP